MAKIRFNALKIAYSGFDIVLGINVSATYRNAIQAILDAFNAGNEFEIKPYKPKRSLSANAYCWVLADKLAAKLNSTKEEVYRGAVTSVGVFTEISVTNAEAAQRFVDVWGKNGIGWIAVPIDDTTLLAYYGSSCYSTQEMARLIDFLQDECRQLNIEVRSKEEIDSLLESWGK